MTKTLVFLGDTRSRAILKRIRPLGWGRMWCNVLPPSTLDPDEPWALDNGAFVAWKKGEEVDPLKFAVRATRASDRVAHPPALAIAPDIVAGGMKSLEQSRWFIERVRSVSMLLPLTRAAKTTGEGCRAVARWPWFLAVQDGITPTDLTSKDWEVFDGIFLGGTNQYKATAREWRQASSDHGKLFHYGRAGTIRKLHHALESQCDSLDSAFPLWSKERLGTFILEFLDGPVQLSWQW